MFSKNFKVLYQRYKTSGMTLVEILVAVVIIGGIGLGVMNLSQQTSKSTAKIEMSSDLTSTANEINALLSDPIKCKLTFKDTNKPTSVVSGYDDSDPPQKQGQKFEVFTDVNKATIGASNLKILGYELIKNNSNPEDSTLEITFQNKTVLNDKEPTTKRTLGMYVEWNGNSVEECRTLAGSTTTIWNRGTGTNIYYDGGNVGINTDNPTAALHVVGNVVVNKITAAAFLYKSDKRLKENIKQIDYPLEKVLALRGVTFDWIDNQEKDYGFIAQEVQEVIPEIVHDDSSLNVLTVDYAKVIPLLVEAMKEQQKEIEKLEAEVIRLESR